MSRPTRQQLERNRRGLAQARECLDVPWPLPSVTPEQERAAARALGLLRYLPEPQQPLEFDSKTPRTPEGPVAPGWDSRTSAARGAGLFTDARI